MSRLHPERPALRDYRWLRPSTSPLASLRARLPKHRSRPPIRCRFQNFNWKTNCCDPRSSRSTRRCKVRVRIDSTLGTMTTVWTLSRPLARSFAHTVPSFALELIRFLPTIRTRRFHSFIRVARSFNNERNSTYFARYMYVS